MYKFIAYKNTESILVLISFFMEKEMKHIWSFDVINIVQRHWLRTSNLYTKYHLKLFIFIIFRFFKSSNPTFPVY